MAHAVSPKLDTDLRFLDMAGRLALRGHGRVEPNPMVGCIIAHGDEIVGWGYHQRFGGPHAEIMALRRAGSRAKGATCYLTLEPCAHHGKTKPCTEALIKAKIARAVIAQTDPHPEARGGADRLREAGIEVMFDDRSRAANLASAPFRHRIETGLPWVIAKWAQTIDGRVVARSGSSQWISNARSRRLVHRERGRVDAILTGIGTVLADDPLMNARDVRVRRRGRRVIVDPHLDTPLTSRIVRSARETPTTIACLLSAMSESADTARALESAGVEIMSFAGEERFELEPLLRALVEKHDVTTVLVEAGPRLVGALFRERLVNALWVFIGPTVLGDRSARSAAEGLVAEEISDGVPMTLVTIRRRDEDVILHYLVGEMSDDAPEHH